LPFAPRRHTPAFTLIELLVVVSIIALLVSLTLTGLTKARAAARGVLCQNNLRGLGQAFSLYQNRFDTLPETTQTLINVPGNQCALVTMLAEFHDVPDPAVDHAVLPWACPCDSRQWPTFGSSYIYYPAIIYTQYSLVNPHERLRSLMERHAHTEVLFEGIPFHGIDYHVLYTDGSVSSKNGPLYFN
jgi:prepilin-type N-terminal cleavage/methylation domain-containing protein